MDPTTESSACMEDVHSVIPLSLSPIFFYARVISGANHSLMCTQSCIEVNLGPHAIPYLLLHSGHSDTAKFIVGIYTNLESYITALKGMLTVKPKADQLSLYVCMQNTCSQLNEHMLLYLVSAQAGCIGVGGLPLQQLARIHCISHTK